uniref:Uncharacterized protein n=1 Tax=viral metagenome TaxID=1070528 RepID=A0A6C0I4Q2_9ZZZZ
MPARLGMNGIEYYPWKGKTFVQITSYIKHNNWINKMMDKTSFFRPPPVKLHRREIVSTYDMSRCNVRTSSSINVLDQPGGSILLSNTNANVQTKGLPTTVDIGYPNNVTEQLGQCNDPYTCNATNARNRVRSSGMIKKKFDESRNNDRYYTNASQYLVSRNKTFQQNQYNFIRVGDPSLLPGDAQSVTNIYSPQGLNHCQQYYVPVDTSFGYQWLDASNYQVSIPSGHYNLDDVNALLKDTMANNEHYFINNNGGNKVFLLNMTYNTAASKVELQTFLSNRALFATTHFGQYSAPTDMSYQLWINGPNTSSLVDTSGVPTFIIKDNAFQGAIGFNAGTYPSRGIGEGQTLTNQSFLSAFTPGLSPTYVPIYYKPNNPQFSQQGGVTASSLITRVRYNTITNNTAAFRRTYGSAVANSLAYGVPEYGYTTKDKVGYPNKCTPTFSKSSGEQRNCNSNTIVHQI